MTSVLGWVLFIVGIWLTSKADTLSTVLAMLGGAGALVSYRLREHLILDTEGALEEKGKAAKLSKMKPGWLAG